MNQIFRVIWNHATQSWVAVSELTKAHKKASSSNTIKTFLGATALLFSLNGAEAALAISDVTSDGKVVSSGATASGNTAIAIGVSTVSGSGFGVAIGKNARAEKGGQSIAIGGGNNSGEGAVAKGSQSIAIGGNTIAEGDSSIAIGGDDVDEAVKATVTYTNPQNGASKTDTIKQAFQDLTGVDILNPRWTPTKAYNAATAIGMKAEAKELAVSMGTLARAQKVNSVALGSGALATLDNAIALGAGSKTDKQGTKQTQTTVQGITYKWAGGDKTSIGDVVSVGSAGFERQIKNVAAGEVSNVSTDAINGSQLYGVLSNLTTGAFLNYAGDDADGKDKSDTTVIKQSIAENRLDIRGGADKAALTNENIGVNNENGKLWVKLAKDLKGLNSTTVGGIVTNASGIDMSNKPITNLAAGTNSTDAVNKSQLDKVANNNIKLGGDSGTTDAQQLDKTGGLQFNVKGTNGLTTEASGTDVTVKLDDATKAAVDSIANKIENNKIKLSATNDSTSTDQQDLNKSGGIEFKVKGDNGLTASALGDTVTLKLDDATKAKVDSVDSKIGDNNISLGSDSGSTDTQALTNAGGMKFNIKGENGLTTTASGKDVTVKLDDTTKDKIDNAADKDLSNITDAGKKQIKDQVTWKAKATNSKADLDQDTKDSDDTAETIGADSILTLDAGKNLRLQRKGKEFTYGLESNLTGINSITGLANTLPVTKNDAVAPTTNQPAPTNVDGTKAASVNDILNAGWNLKENDTDKDFVKAYDTVNFVDGTGTTANVTVTENGAVSAVKFDVKKTTLTADADKGTVSAGNAGDSFATANDVANAINKAFWKVTGAEDGGEFAEGNTTTEEAVKAGDKVTFKAGKNIKLKQAGKDFTYSLNPVLSDITSIGGNGTTMTFKPEGVDLGGKKITNIAPGTDDKDAVNKSQLDTAVQEVAEKPLSFSGDNKEAGKFNRTLGTEVKVVGGADASKLSDNNIGVIGDKTDTLTVKLAKSLKGLSDVEVKDDAGNTTNITPNGITISQPEKDGKKPDNVSLTKDGLNNGGQNITNVAGNLPGAKKDTTAPTTSSEGPSATDLPNITNNAATVGDVLNTGWNLQNNGKAKDFVKPYDTVNFIDGEGTTAVVETKDNKVSTVKYDVKLGAGLKKDDKGNITVDAGNITNENGAPKVADADKDKVATAGNVADAINNSYWTASAEKDGKVIGKDDNIKPSGKVTFDAGKNIEIDHSTPNKFTFKTVDNPEFKTLDLNDGAGNKVNLAPTADGLKLGKGDKNEPANITNVTSGLKPYGDAKPDAKELVNLDTPNVSDNTAATVGDLRNMGWIVGTPENKYVDTVKNANKVDFKAGAGISVTGKTTGDIREITIAVKEGEVVKPNDDPANAGTGYVTGNKVATAIQKSGFVVGKQAEKLSAADFKDEDEKVNPDDELRFADGNNTKVKLATKESVDKDGNKVTTTTVKVDVTGLPVQYTDKNGTPVTKVGDKYFTVDKDGNPTTTEVAPADLTTNMVNPAAAPNEIGAPTTLGNVKSNLPSVNDADKNAKDVDGKPIAGKDNKSAPIDAAKAADIAKNAGNNAATVSDVLNAGWNLQNNGEAKDFVKPYDTVNFVDGKGTKAVVKTEEDGTTSNVKFDIDTGSITNNADGSVQGPVVTPEMTKALEDATNTLNNLPANAPASVRKAAEQAVADAANNIANVANKVATAQDVANAINKSGFTLTTSANGGEKISGTPEMINPGKKVEMVAGKNMTVKQESNGKVTYATASNVTFDSVQFGDNGPKITNNGGNINVGTATGAPTKITGVAPGEISATSKDAVNGSQLYAMGNKLQGQINKLGNRMNAGMATSAAMANLLQPHKPGQSVATAGIGQHKNQSAVAVGYSRISDNGKYGVRFSMGANTQGEVTGGAAVGYFW
ncbi:ESPR-type extended signal peptide-containing protein [Haemophilus haemolyticus]|uniref:ESPR-type extended signal peptide-containing protein n=1 Tax=Haemophilus haemolyticus TaxID=726 RepID=UPI001066F990|nr:ESPR-type extended signal peptide-containing protein [Haemophilus haemolyticus]